jgi:hypothetical protein
LVVVMPMAGAPLAAPAVLVAPVCDSYYPAFVIDS